MCAMDKEYCYGNYDILRNFLGDVKCLNHLGFFIIYRRIGNNHLQPTTRKAFKVLKLEKRDESNREHMLSSKKKLKAWSLVVQDS